MKRFHIHLGVTDLEKSVQFYSGLFGQTPDVLKADYAKWLLAEPAVNFAISTRTQSGLDHLGFQVTDAQSLADVRQHYEAAEGPIMDQPDATCCYSRSDKHWTTDPDGVAWEAFHTLTEIPTFNEQAEDTCCTPKSATRSCC
ncbi:ArsI/CadI family heavy metal resistance metalloenzyme [Marinobacteraceae bacterium S3BR75-40.1]